MDPSAPLDGVFAEGSGLAGNDAQVASEPDVRATSRPQRFFAPNSYDSETSGEEKKLLLDEEDPAPSPQRSDKTEVSVVDDVSATDLGEELV